VLSPIRRKFLLVLVFFFFTASGILLRAQSSASPQGCFDQDSKEDPLQRPLPKTKKHAKSDDEAYRKWLNEVVPDIITGEERGAFKKLANNIERDNFIENFWQIRNPNPESPVNEFKEEHYRRLAYANEHFSAGIPGSRTDRGRIYIIHGAPDSIESQPMGGPYQRPADQGGGQTETYPFEIWRYRNMDGIGQEVEIEFVDTCSCGDYHMTIDPGEKDAFSHVPGAGPTLSESLGLSTKADRFRGGGDTLGPSLFGSGRQSKQFDALAQLAKVNAPPPIRYRALKENVRSTIHEILPFNVRVDFVKADADRVMVPITIQVPNHELTYALKDGVQHASLTVSGQLTTLGGAMAGSFEDPLRLDIPAELLNSNMENPSLYQQVLIVPPGRYRLDVVAKDLNGTKAGTWAQPVNVPNFADLDRLAASSLILADLMEPVAARDAGPGRFVLGASKVRPRVPSANGEPPVFRSGQKINLWMQVYNLALDAESKRPSASVEYHVVNTANNQTVSDFSGYSNQSDSAGRQITLQRTVPDKLAPGVYQVTIDVKDLISQQSLAASARFAIK